ncbi:hypothetical protein GA0116948_113113 [Chitinophaga costaii]|uniref:Uncharacterized protein n=1 Tax=Chitinophaga costaii TaxID=1335309 RepID=A0A1C4FFC2_9BACT|nr:hypothetical protein [Chitinophaga costaii]PUZ20644.1 hypothetical protein DCM91_17905 [Chitinophaga costaii]SCC54171.1 hypothetical protein GA0116948_113113 [Chitinophaga costaii]
MKATQAMKAACCLLLACFAFCRPTWAQTTDAQVIFSAPIEEPASGWCKLLLLKNGHTFFLRFTPHDGILVNIYDTAHTLQRTDTIGSIGWDAHSMADAEIDGLYEINGQVVLFLQQQLKYKPTLFRLVLDGNDGHLLREDKLGELASIQQHQAAALNNEASHDCFVEKDPRSGYYAVALFNGTELAHDSTDAGHVEVIHFAPDHHEIHRVQYYLPDSSYEYFNYLNMQVQGGEAVYLASMAFNTHTNKHHEDSRLLIARLGATDTVFTFQPADQQHGAGNAWGMLQCMPGQPLRLLVTAQPADINRKKNTSLMPVYFLSFDARTLQPVAQEQLPMAAASDYAKAHLQYQDKYTGMLQAWLPLADGSSLLLQESIRQFIQGGATFKKTITGLGDAGITHLDANGKEEGAVVLNKIQSAAGTYQPFYQYRRNKSEWSFRNRNTMAGVNGYLSYAMVQNKKGNYFLYNQLVSTTPGDYSVATRPLRTISEAGLVCYHYVDGQLLQLKLFPPPPTLLEAPTFYACMLDAAAEDAVKNCYATVMIAHNDTVRKAYLAWIVF